jgi:NAD(P)-dependent dehydrogenase (short-subunit alcohol dehydrogenase family)
MTGDGLTDRVAVVTGGAGALGQAITRRLLADGAAVAVPWAVAGEAERLAAAVGADERQRLFLAPTDVLDDGALGRFVAAVLDRWRRVDVLVAAVGGFAGGALVDTSRETWDQMLAINLTSVYTATRAVVPGMVAAGFGRVVIIASRAVVMPGPGFIAYTAAKAGVIAFTQALAVETRAHGVTANAVLPSTMDTPANRAAMPDADPKAWVPVDSVADAVAFLARPASSHVTGALLAI